MDLERAMEFLVEQQAAYQAQSDARLTRIEETLDRTTRIAESTRAELRRAVRLSVQEAQAERKRRKDADEKLAASQEELRQSLKAFIDSMRQPRNGHDKN